MTILWKNLHLIWDCGVTDLVYSGLWEYIKGRVLGVQRVNLQEKCLFKVRWLHVHFTFVYPYLIYCVEVWGNACDTHLDPIIKIQKKCVRVITFSHYLEPTESLFKDLKILAFKKLVIQRILLLMFKKVKFIIIILDIVARIQRLVNLKQHIELLVIMQF